ncbi:type II toxin-antitoxin system antitoxin SocA domain-containing protein [Nostoc sp.]|uniref:type II toxin-antitoxin system antitoxin SocA domain-containing protein n=1 Tax=Nostoc sp. TaxID=1180 RepID=UPI002FF7D394
MLDKLIKYFVYETKGYITKTQLIKFLYLADLYSVKWTGKQLTELEWYYYNYGPWHEDIDAALNKMNGKEIIQESQGNTTLIKLGAEAVSSDYLELPVSLKLVLDNIRREWAGSGQDKLNQLLDYVYSTAPMLEVKDIHKPDEKVLLNLQTEREKLISELGL